MEEVQDYYALLGVSQNAAISDIKKAFVRKGREYGKDQEKLTQINQAYDVLCDPAKRKQYDLHMRFGNQVEEIREKIRNSETPAQWNQNLAEAQRIYQDLLKADPENTDALWNLAGIEESLGNEAQAILYLKELEKYTDGEDKLQVCHRLGTIYRELKKTDEAVRYFHAIYKADAAYADDVKALVRLYYEEKRDIKTAIQILNDCIHRSSDSKLKIIYLCETLRAIRILKGSSYRKVEETLYTQLEKFHTKDAERNLMNAAAMFSCIEDVIRREDFECFHRLEKIYEAYDVNHMELNQAFEAARQIAALMEKGKVHKAIVLYLKKQWTKEIKAQIGRLIITEAQKIKESLECIQKEASAYWHLQKELQDLENVVNDNLTVSKELNELSADRTISDSMKKMMEYIFLDGFVAFEDIKDEFADARDTFFEKEDRENVRYTLWKMEEQYPLCYKIFADIFLDGKSTQELFKSAPVNSGGKTGGLRYSWGYFFGGCLLFLVPVLGVIVLVLTYCYARSKNAGSTEEDESAKKRVKEKTVRRKEKIYKRLKAVFILSVVVLMGAAAFKAGISIKERIQRKQEEAYEEDHNLLLTDRELKERDKLEEEYKKKTNVDIHVLQMGQNGVEDFPDGEYIWMIIKDDGWYGTSYVLETNFLSYDEQEVLSQGINDLCNSDSSDFEKCEKFYALAYGYIQVHQAKFVLVPDITGMTMEEAKTELAGYGLYLEKKKEVYSSDYEEGTIIYQYLENGMSVEKGTTIYVKISLGAMKTYEDTPIRCFYLQQEAVNNYITADDILRCWDVSKKDCSITTKYDAEGYMINRIGFHTSCYGIQGYFECELRVSEDAGKTDSVNFVWYPYPDIQTETMADLLVSEGYTPIESIGPDYSADVSVFESDMGKLLVEHGYNISRIRFVSD